MPVAITVRNVPDEVRNELAARAAAHGWSLQEFMLHELIELAGRPDRHVLLARIEARLDGTTLTIDQLIDATNADRK